MCLYPSLDRKKVFDTFDGRKPSRTFLLMKCVKISENRNGKTGLISNRHLKATFVTICTDGNIVLRENSSTGRTREAETAIKGVKAYAKGH